MSTIETKIRPRLRSTDTPTPHNVSAPAASPAMPNDEMPPLVVLARLPDVSPPPERAKLSPRLDWLKSVRWSDVRRMNWDPNWVAGGVLALVLFLLLVITLNRGSKPGGNTPSGSDAPTWNSAGAVRPSSPPSSMDAAVSRSTALQNNAASNEASSSTAAQSTMAQSTGGDQSSPNSAESIAPSRDHFADGGAIPLDNIYYPRTAYAEPAGIMTRSAAPASAQQPDVPFNYGEEIRTAQRDRPGSHSTAVQVTPPQAGRPTFDGNITQP